MTKWMHGCICRMQRWQMKSITDHVNGMKQKDPMTISIDAEKNDKIQHPLMIKTLKLEMLQVINMIKAIYEDPTVNTTLDGERQSGPGRITSVTRMFTSTTSIQQSIGSTS